MNKVGIRLICVVYVVLISIIVSVMICCISPIDTNTIEQTNEVTTSLEPMRTTYESIALDNIDEPTEDIMTEPEYRQWWTDDELDMLAAVIFYEAGSDDCSDRHQQLVACVVLNRVVSSKFPNTIYEVITQQKPVQYSTYKLVLKNMGNRDIIPQRCYDNALKALYDEVDCPDNIIWQANFTQGSKIYEIHKTSYSITYFCYE